ncbi:unnamed protein product, partial [Rotaria magnacalcarata]
PSTAHGLDIKDICMLNCCVEENCDLAMLSEQRTNKQKDDTMDSVDSKSMPIQKSTDKKERIIKISATTLGTNQC